MGRMKDMIKALKVIEEIAMYGLDRSVDLTTDEQTKEYKDFSAIYRHAHAVTRGLCYNTHDGWRDELGKSYTEYLKRLWGSRG